MRAILLLILAVVNAAPGAEPVVVEASKSRQEFAAAMSKVKKGMPADEVGRLLGKPDDIRTLRDAGGISTTRTKEIWRYGAAEHLAMATLGQVYIDTEGCVQYIYGQGAPSKNLPAERDLRALLVALGDVPSYSAYNYQPRHVIRAVNLLQPLGKEVALAVIDEYLRVSSHFHDAGREGTFLVLRTLFDVPEDPGYFPHMAVGAFGPSRPADEKLLPRYPLTLEDDIPLLVVDSYFLAGEPEQPEQHLEWFRKHGKLRKRPLVPGGKPFETIERLRESRRWSYASAFDEERQTLNVSLLQDEIFSLLDSVYRVPLVRGYFPRDPERRAMLLAEAGRLEVRWDADLNLYTFADGKFLPAIKPIQYHREIWRPKLKHRDVEVIIERQDADSASLMFEENVSNGVVRPRLTLKVYASGKPKDPLLESEIGEAGAMEGTGSVYQSQSFKLPEGTEIQLLLTTADGDQRSPAYKP